MSINTKYKHFCDFYQFFQKKLPFVYLHKCRSPRAIFYGGEFCACAVTATLTRLDARLTELTMFWPKIFAQNVLLSFRIVGFRRRKMTGGRPSEGNNCEENIY
jgi:hypothetical protein